MHVYRTNESALPDGLKRYTDPNELNKVIYYQRSADADARMQQLTDADILLALCESGYNDSTEYEFFQLL